MGIKFTAVKQPEDENSDYDIYSIALNDFGNFIVKINKYVIKHLIYFDEDKKRSEEILKNEIYEMFVKSIELEIK